LIVFKEICVEKKKIFFRDEVYVQSVKMLRFIGDDKDLIKLVVSETEFGKLCNFGFSVSLKKWFPSRATYSFIQFKTI
jgi:hypothetical protein